MSALNPVSDRSRCTSRVFFDINVWRASVTACSCSLKFFYFLSSSGLRMDSNWVLFLTFGYLRLALVGRFSSSDWLAHMELKFAKLLLSTRGFHARFTFVSRLLWQMESRMGRKSCANSLQLVKSMLCRWRFWLMYFASLSLPSPSRLCPMNARVLSWHSSLRWVSSRFDMLRSMGQSSILSSSRLRGAFIRSNSFSFWIDFEPISVRFSVSIFVFFWCVRPFSIDASVSSEVRHLSMRTFVTSSGSNSQALLNPAVCPALRM